jgi:hypothetical protein
VRIGLWLGIDDLLIIPGFGAFMRGWMICRARRTELVSLKLGEWVLGIEPGSHTQCSRSDLVGLSKHLLDPAILATAGFTDVFRGAAPKAWFGRPLVRIETSTGEFFLLPVNAEVIRVCAESRDLRAIAEHCPGLSQKFYFYEFVESFGKAVRAHARNIRPVKVQKVPRALVFCLPIQPDDMILAFDKVSVFCADLPDDVGIVFLYTPLHAHGRVLALMNDIRSRRGRPVSLIHYNDPVYALWSLRPTLDLLDCKSFWFVAPNVMPTKSGWRLAAQIFEEQHIGISSFADDRLSEGSASSLSFTWSTASFETWERGAPFFLSGFYRDNGLPQPATIAKGTIRHLVSANVPNAIEAWDARLFELRQAEPMKASS